MRGSMQAFAVGLMILIMSFDRADGGGLLDGGPLRYPRSFHTATALSDGKVLLAGGSQGLGFVTNRTEIWDPSLNTTQFGANMLTSRSGHTATMMGNGKILFVGGGYAAEVFDPVASTSTMVYPGVSNYYGHTATLLNDGRVLIVGPVGLPELFDPIAETFTPSANSRSLGGDYHTATMLCDGNVLITGGGNRSAEIFNPTTNSFTPTNLMAVIRRNHSATLISCNEVLVVGGTSQTRTTEIYDVASGMFSAGPTLSDYRSERHVAVKLPSGEILFAGGEPYYNRSLELWNPTTRLIGPENLDVWEPRGPGVAAALFADKVLLSGGGDLCGAGYRNYVYLPTAVAPPPPVVSSVTPNQGFTCGGKAITIAGSNFSTQAVARVGYSSVTITSRTSTEIRGTVPTGSAGASTVTVTNPDQQRGTLANGFTYVVRPTGDANADNRESVADIFYMINNLFAGGPVPPPCEPPE